MDWIGWDGRAAVGRGDGLEPAATAKQNANTQHTAQCTLDTPTHNTHNNTQQHSTTLNNTQQHSQHTQHTTTNQTQNPKGAFPANRYASYMTSSTSVALSLKHREMVILGTEYAGEMKKGVFR